MLRVLVIDDNPDDRALAIRALAREHPDLQVDEVIDQPAFDAALQAGAFDVVITDYQLRWNDGLTLLKSVKGVYPDRPVIMFTNTGSEEVCAEAMKIGLHDYIIKKPGQYVRLPHAVRAALEFTDTQARLAAREQELEQLYEREQAARAEAETANRLKDEFLSTLSHELRTPLNAILGWTQILQRGGSAPEKLERGLGIIERNVRALTQLIDDLLDLSRIVAGKLRLDVQRVDLIPVVEAALESIQPAADAKGIRVQRVLDPLAGPVSGDPARLQQVVVNLLSNAVKFTPPDGRIHVTLERVDSHVELAVSDTGAGIAPEALPHIFERLRQADSSTTRQHGGLGLGLAIVKQLVEMHGGGVRAKSCGIGQGATFVVTLPILPAAVDEGTDHLPSAAEWETATLPSPTLRGLKLLVVDDEPDARELVQMLLEHAKAEVRTAGSAAEALGLFQAARPDVLVSDIGMPHQDGYTLIDQVRRLEAATGSRVPAVALTAFARPEDRRRALLAGYQVHVSKPVDAGELVAVIAALAGRTGPA